MSNDRLGFLKWRIEAIRAGFSIPDLLNLWMPASRRSPSIYAQYLAWRDATSKKALGGDGESVPFLGRKLYHRGNFREIEDQFKEIVDNDWYCTEQCLKPDSIVIDAGGCIGVFSALAATRSKHVYAFEPSPLSNSLLRRTAEQYPNLTVEQMALGESDKTATLIVSDNEPNLTLGGNYMEDSVVVTIGGAAPSNRSREETVAVTSIDNYVKAHNIPKVDFIKIDTEGYERMILRGAEKTITKHKKPVIAMASYHVPSDFSELPELLRSFREDYRIKLVGDNFICT